MISTPRYYDQYTVEGTTPATGVISRKTGENSANVRDGGIRSTLAKTPFIHRFIPP